MAPRSLWPCAAAKAPWGANLTSWFRFVLDRGHRCWSWHSIHLDISCGFSTFPGFCKEHDTSAVCFWVSVCCITKIAENKDNVMDNLTEGSVRSERQTAGFWKRLWSKYDRTCWSEITERAPRIMCTFVYHVSRCRLSSESFSLFICFLLK